MLCLAVCAEACLVTPVLTVFPNRYNYLAQFRAASVNTPIPTSSPNAPVLSSNERHPFQDLMESNSWTLSEDAFGSDGALRSAAAAGMKESAPHKGLPAQRGPPPPSLRKTAEKQQFCSKEVKVPLLALPRGVRALHQTWTGLWLRQDFIVSGQRLYSCWPLRRGPECL